MPDALGGPDVPPYNKYYYDLSTRLTGGQFLPGAQLTFSVKFVRKGGVTFSYAVTPYGEISQQNLTPSVTISPVPPVTLPAGANLTATVTDDGKILGHPNLTWSMVSGPGTVTFGTPNAATTTASFSADGSYVLSLSAYDGELTTTATVNVTVNPAVVQNQPPMVAIAAISPVTLPAAANLSATVTDDGRIYSTPTLTWTVDSGPGTVTFGTPNAASTTATFSAAGTYVLRLNAFDGELNGTATVSATVNPAPILNQAPVVSISPVSPITLPAGAGLSATVTDDGRIYSSPTLTWTMDSGPGTVTFGTPNAATTTATFSTAGTYVIRLNAFDGELTGTATVSVTVNPAVIPNQAPVVSIAPVSPVTLPAGASLSATVTDDGRIYSSPTLTWTMDSGPGTVTFGTSNAATTTATFSTSGTYIIRLTAYDGELTGSETVSITVHPAVIPNQVPSVTIASVSPITLPANAGLSATVTDDGRIYSSPTLTWTMDSGPGTVTFGTPNAATTTATFSAPGTYVLRLTAYDGELTGTATVSVTVNPAPIPNQAPVVTIAPVAPVTLPASASLIATVTDDGKIFTSPVLAWSVDSGPGTVTFGSPNAATTAATFSAAGAHALRLSAFDGELTSAATITVTVLSAQNRPPSIITASLPDARIDQQYSVGIVATDPDNDPLAFTLTQGPVGMAMAPASGNLQWMPTISSIGSYPVGVTVSDGRGGTDSRQYILNVPDTIAPGISLGAPKEVIPGASFRVVAQASDNIGVTQVTITVDGQGAVNFPTGPYQRDITLPASIAIGTQVNVLASARDAANNIADASAIVSVVGTPNVTPPTVKLNAPAQVTAGASILLSASAASGQGIDLLSFAADGTAIGTASAVNPSIAYQVPAGLSTGATISFSVTASDYSGNSAQDSVTSTVVAQPDISPPVVTITAPQTILLGSRISGSLNAADDTGIARVDLSLDHTRAMTFTSGGNIPFDLVLPQNVAAGMDLLIEAQATDFSGNIGSASSTVRVTAPVVRQGVVTGAVYDDSTGLPLDGATVTLSMTGKQDQNASTDDRGRYSFIAEEGVARITASKSGFTQVERTSIPLVDNTGRRVQDARLTPLNPQSVAVSAVLGGTITAPFKVEDSGLRSALVSAGITTPADRTFSLAIDAGAFTTDQQVVLTQVGAQGPAGKIPAGWSPLAAVDIAPRGILLAVPAVVDVPNMLGISSSSTVAVVRWDENDHAWKFIAAPSFSADGATLSSQLPSTGQYAFVLPDDGSAAQLPNAGEQLAASNPVAIPMNVQAVVTPKPKIIFYKPGVRSDVGTRASASVPMTSGTPMWANLAEEYNFYDGNRITTEPYFQDITLYTFGDPAGNLVANYRVSPGADLSGHVLEKGIITVTAAVPTDGSDQLSVIGPQGGTISTGNGESVTFPANAVSQFIPVSIKPFKLDESGLAIPAGHTLAGGVILSLAGNKLSLPAQVSVPLPSNINAAGDLLLVTTDEIMGRTQFIIVGTGAVQGNQIVSQLDISSIHFPGILNEGRFLFLQPSQSVGYCGGTVRGITNQPFSGAVVTSDSLPFAALSGLNGSYATAVVAGVFNLTATDPIKLDAGSASGTVAAKGAVISDISMQIDQPRVVSIVPANNAAFVPLADPIRIRFSKPMVPSTINPSSVQLTEPTGRIVPSSLALSGDAREATLRPADILISNTKYTVTVAQSVRDVGGYTMAATFTSSFTSIDTAPPPAPPAGSITATIPGANGTTTIYATQGTAGTHDTVYIVNTTTRARNQVIVDANGGFNAIINAGTRDRLQVEIVSPAGVTTTVNLPRFRQVNADGSISAVVGPEGGLVEGPGGVVADVPAGAFPDSTVITLNSVDEASFPIQFTPEQKRFFTYSGGIQMDLGGKAPAEGSYINLAVPAQPGDDVEVPHPFYGRLGEGGQWLVSQVINVDGANHLNAIDTARVINDRITTSSPPCPGATGNGVYGFFKARDVMGISYGRIDIAAWSLAQASNAVLSIAPLPGASEYATFGSNTLPLAYTLAVANASFAPTLFCFPVLSGRVNAVPNNVNIIIDTTQLHPEDIQISILNTTPSRTAEYTFSRGILDAKYRSGDRYAIDIEGGNQDTFEARVLNYFGATNVYSCGTTTPAVCRVEPFNLVTVSVPASSLTYTSGPAAPVVDVRGNIHVRNISRGTVQKYSHFCRYPNNPPVSGVTAQCDSPDVAFTVEGSLSDLIRVDVIADVSYQTGTAGLVTTATITRPDIVPALASSGLYSSSTGTTGSPPGNLLIRAIQGVIDPTRSQIDQHNALYPAHQVNGFGVTGVFITNKTLGASVDITQPVGACSTTSCPIAGYGSCVGSACYSVPLDSIKQGAFTYPIEGSSSDTYELTVVYENGRFDPITLPTFSIRVQNLTNNQVIRTVTGQAPPRGRPFNIGIVTPPGGGTTLVMQPPTSLILDPQSTITLNFSNPVTPTSVQSGFYIMDSSGNRVDGTFTYENGYTTVIFTPNIPFKMGQVYQVAIGGVQDIVGNTLPFSSTSFTVTQPTKIASLSYGMIGPGPQFEPIADIDILRKNIAGNPSTYAVAVMDAMPGWQMRVIDVTDPVNPTEISNVFGGAGRQKRVSVVPDASFSLRSALSPTGSLCHLGPGASTFSGDMAVATASNVAMPFGQISRIRMYDLTPAGATLQPPAACVMNGKLLTVDPMAAHSPSWDGSFRAVGFVQGVATLKYDTGNAAYAAIGEVGLAAIDIGKNIPPYFLPEKPEQEGLYSGDYKDVAVTGNPPQAINLNSIQITPESSVIDKCSGPQVVQYTAIGSNSNGSIVNLGNLSWSTSNPGVATIGQTGIAVAGNTGDAYITATNGTLISNTAQVHVKTLSYITVGPDLETIKKGKTLQFWAIGHYNDGTMADISRNVSWTSSNTIVATINASGLATGVSGGLASISAAFCGVTGTASLTVKELISIALTPASVSLLIGENQVFNATGLYSDGSQADLGTLALWSSSTPTVASVISPGVATAIGIGTTYINASYESITSNGATISVGTSKPVSYSVVINEIVVEPKQDWSDTLGGDNIPFNAVPGNAPPTNADQWIEIVNNGAPADLRQWTLEFFDMNGTLVSRPVGTVLIHGQRAVIGDPGNISLNSRITLKDVNGFIVDEVDLAALHALLGNATGPSNEALARIPDGFDTNQPADFRRRSATINNRNQ